MWWQSVTVIDIDIFQHTWKCVSFESLVTIKNFDTAPRPRPYIDILFVALLLLLCFLCWLPLVGEIELIKGAFRRIRLGDCLSARKRRWCCRCKWALLNQPVISPSQWEVRETWAVGVSSRMTSSSRRIHSNSVDVARLAVSCLSRRGVRDSCGFPPAARPQFRSQIA